jgi:nitrogenase molybdenum-iron protein alpha/beta subunit
MLSEIKQNHSKFSCDPMIGCALEGVSSVLCGIDDASIVVHSPQGCSVTVNSGYGSHGTNFFSHRSSSTRLLEKDIIMGAAGKLKNVIRQSVENYKSKTTFVLGTCAVDIIGEDIDEVCRSLQCELPSQLIPVMSGGFRGNYYEGIDFGLAQLFPIIEDRTPIPDTVNIICPQVNMNPTWTADLEWVFRILKFMGISVNTVFTHKTTLESIKNSGRASANIVLSLDAGIDFAKRLEKEKKIPHILAGMPLPVGCTNTKNWIMAIGQYFHKEQSAGMLIETGENFLVSTLQEKARKAIPKYRHCRALISSDATYSISMLRMLYEEMELIPEVILVRSDNCYARSLLQKELETLHLSSDVSFLSDGYTIKQALVRYRPDIVFGSAWEFYLAEELGLKPAIDLFTPTNKTRYIGRSYFGYEGMINILEIIINDWNQQFRSKEIRQDFFERTSTVNGVDV